MSTQAKKKSQKGAARNQIRIGGGTWRSRVLAFPDAPGLRPTPDRVRQTLFNWLGQTLHDQICLDAFAGSGALGFEAASRGAREVVLCESHPAAADALLRSAALLDANQCQIQRRSVFEFLKVNARKFDVVFCDPPFGDQVHATFLAGLIPHLADQALVYVESAEALELLVADGRRYRVEKFSKAGAVYFGLLRFIPAS